MTTLNETISQSLRQAGLTGYERQAQPVVAALVAREQQITAGLLDAAQQAGVNRNEAARTFEGLGLTMPAQPAEVAQQGDTDLMARLERLETLARNNGLL